MAKRVLVPERSGRALIDDEDWFGPLYPWQQTLWQQLISDHARGHAWLFHGPSGTGKRRLVRHYMAWWLCAAPQPEGACGQCVSCQWLRAGTHGSIQLIEPGVDDSKTPASRQTSIRIEQIRDVIPFAQQQRNQPQLIVIDPADAMTTAASNALLKLLEEPVPLLRYLLVSDRVGALLPTVRSRVQRIDTGRIGLSVVREFLTRHGIAESDHSELLALSGPVPLAALEFAQAEQLAVFRHLIQDWLLLRQGQRVAITLAAEWHKRMPIETFLQLVRRVVRAAVAERLGVGDATATALGALLVSTPWTLVQWWHLDRWILDQLGERGQNIQPSLIYDSVWAQMAANPLSV